MIKARGNLYRQDMTPPYNVHLTKTRYTQKELVALVRTLGKRAQARLQTLRTYYTEQGTRYTGRLNPLTEIYKGYDVKTAGLSRKALYQKVKTAVAILNDKRSTHTGYTAMLIKSYEGFKKTHPQAREWTIEQWEKYAKFLGAFEAAHEEQQYDSEAVVSMAAWEDQAGRAMPDPEAIQVEDVTNWFINRVRERKKGEWVTLSENFDFEKGIL